MPIDYITIDSLNLKSDGPEILKIAIDKGYFTDIIYQCVLVDLTKQFPMNEKEFYRHRAALYNRFECIYRWNHC